MSVIRLHNLPTSSLSTEHVFNEQTIRTLLVLTVGLQLSIKLTIIFWINLLVV